MKEVSVILPSYKPDEKLLKTVIALEEYGFEDIIVVDDGGGEEFNHYFDEVRERESCTVLVHPENRGKGAAMKTAFAWYLENRSGAGVVTVDGDGQHFPKDVKNCVDEMIKTEKIVLGVRDFSLPDVPARSRMGNRITSAVFRIFVGMKCSDTQTGLRAFPTSVLKKMLEIDGDRYEYETNQLLYMKRYGLDFSEVTITTVYINENETSHFRPFRDSARIYGLIFKYLFTSTFMKFMASSGVSYIIDLALFTLIGYLLSGSQSNILKVTVPYIAARALSSFVNYSLNRRVFKQEDKNIKSTVFKYYALAIAILLVGSVVVTLILKELYSIPAVLEKFAPDFSPTNSGISGEQIPTTILNTLVKIPVDCILYIVSYTVQKKFIFKAD